MRDFTAFESDEEVEEIARRLLDRTLPKSAWTHAAHFAAALWLIDSLGEARAARELPAIIRAYNEATGRPNTETSGYHETITQASLRAAGAFLAAEPGRALFATCNALMISALGESDWLLQYWSRERLFSAEARRTWVEPDQRSFPFEGGARR